MDAIDYVTENERQPKNPRHFVLLQAKSQRELSSYDWQGKKVEWLDRKTKENEGVKGDNSLSDKTLQFKKPLNDNKRIVKKRVSNESEEDDGDEYTVHIGSVITDFANGNQEEMYNTEEDYYNGIAPLNIFQESQISRKQDWNTEAKKPLLKFKSAENVNIIKSKTEGKHFDASNGNNTKNIVDNKTLPKSIIQNLVQEKILWSSEVENLVPKGSSSESLKKELEKIKKTHVYELESPLWNKCGRPKNGFVILEDGSYMCARYRDPHNKLILGEVLSFYLSHLLGLDNVPIVSLSQVNHSSLQWKGVNFNKLQWKEGSLVALIRWIPGISTMRSHVKMPEAIYNAYLQNEPLTQEKLQTLKLNDTTLSDLVQWGSMIIFDYLTGNYDRVASMQDAAMKEDRPSIIQEHIRNLRKSPKTGKFWLIDNESGLLDAYDLLYRDKISGKHFVMFHQQMLRTMCIFQKSVAVSLQTLKNFTSPHNKLEEFAQQHERLLSQVPKDYTYSIFKSMFSKRLTDVSNWIEHCKTRRQV